MTILNGVRYPAPRLKRPGPALPPSPVPAGLVVVPAVRLWPFNLSQATGATPRATVVSPKLVGPAIIKEVVANWTAVANDPPGFWSIYSSEDDSGAGANQTLAAVPSGTRIFDNRSVAQSEVVVFQGEHGIPTQQHTGIVTGIPYPINFVVHLREWFCKVSLTNSTGAGTLVRVWGYLRIIEGIPREDLGLYL